LLRRLTQPARHGARPRHLAPDHPFTRARRRLELVLFDEVAFVVDGIRGKTHIPPSPLLQ
jgi:hypothetical protein